MIVTIIMQADGFKRVNVVRTAEGDYGTIRNDDVSGSLHLGVIQVADDFLNGKTVIGIPGVFMLS